MLRASSGLKRSVMKWVSQVSVSLGATLVATMILSALPRAAAPVAPPEMTSGGKFAARAEPVSTIAYDGLDAMPLPRVTTAAVPVAFLIAPAPGAADVADQPESGQPSAVGQVHQALWEGPSASAAQDHAARKTAKTSMRSEARRTVTPAERPQMVSLATVEPQADVGRSDDGLLPKVMSTARTVWSATASTGLSLLSRLIP